MRLPSYVISGFRDTRPLLSGQKKEKEQKQKKEKKVCVSVVCDVQIGWLFGKVSNAMSKWW